VNLQWHLLAESAQRLAKAIASNAAADWVQVGDQTMHPFAGGGKVSRH
jgi:hypothetical protein